MSRIHPWMTREQRRAWSDHKFGAGLSRPTPCKHCDGTGTIETDNNGTIGPCPMCQPKEAR